MAEEAEIGPLGVPAIFYILGATFYKAQIPLPYMNLISIALIILAIITALIIPLIIELKEAIPLLIVNIIIGGATLAAQLTTPIITLAFILASLAGIATNMLISVESEPEDLEEEETIESPKLLEDLREFMPEPINNEEDLEKQLTQYLRAKGYHVERQVRLAKRLRADLKVDDCIVELKVAYGRDVLQRLLGQIRDYMEHSNCIIALILDPGNNIARKYTGKIREIGAHPIIIKGRLKRK